MSQIPLNITKTIQFQILLPELKKIIKNLSLNQMLGTALPICIIASSTTPLFFPKILSIILGRISYPRQKSLKYIHTYCTGFQYWNGRQPIFTFSNKQYLILNLDTMYSIYSPSLCICCLQSWLIYTWEYFYEVRIFLQFFQFCGREWKLSKLFLFRIFYCIPILILRSLHNITTTKMIPLKYSFIF